MKFVVVSTILAQVTAFGVVKSPFATRTRLAVSTGNIGLGPAKDQKEGKKELVAGVDYEVPNHEEYRTSRRSKLDEQCDKWFGSLLNASDGGVLGDLSDAARTILTTPVELKNEAQKESRDDPEWTPYVTTKLPWTPLVPAFGLEEYGLPVPRRNAETWRHFDVVGMVETDYSGVPEGTGTVLQLSDEQVEKYTVDLVKKGGWLKDDECAARLVYINGRFCPQLSKTSAYAHNLESVKEAPDEVKTCLQRLTDGFTDELAASVPSGDSGFLTSYQKLSGPNHNVGDPTSQFAINVQQGTACFAALNTVHTGAVAYVHQPANEVASKPVLVVNAVTKSGGAESSLDESKGVATHPRALVIADEGSILSFVQSVVDLDETDDHRPKLYNGYTQIFVKGGANVTHSYLEESGGVVTPGTEKTDEELKEGETSPREIEAKRPELRDTHLEAIDVQIVGDDGDYKGTMMNTGGSGRVRVALSVALLRPGSHATVNGFCLSGGAQRTDIKTNIHHVAQGTTSEQNQRNMIGGRATGAFRGRIRVEQSAQQTDSAQLSRSILLSDRARAWSVPSLEIIADDVQCTHGATVSDLSEEELFYLRSRGLTRALARNLLMYAFAGDISATVDPAMLGEVDSSQGLQHRVIQRLENLVPQGDRAIRGEFQSV
jgi:Fe-S cluster assembly scaffold protein SufB